MLRPAAKPYFSSHERSLCHVPLIQMQAWSNLIFYASVLRPHKPYFSYHVPLTQLRSHASTLRVHKPYFSYYFFERIPRSVDLGSFSCKYPSAYKPYFSYQLFERMPPPIDPGSFRYKRPLNSNHPVHRTFLIWSHFIQWTQLIALRQLSSTHATLIRFYS